MRRVNCIFALFFVAVLILPIPVLAQEDFSKPSSSIMGEARVMSRVVNGTSDLSEKRIKGLCNDARVFSQNELGRVKYNDIFHEIADEAQIADINALADAMKRTSDCKAQLRLWIAYDEKWYAPGREKAYAARKAQEQEWASEVKDSGEEIWDGVINGTFFAIPRSYIWFGSGKPDGYQDAMNLRFFFPDFGARPLETTEYGGMRMDIEGLLARNDDETKPCVGIDGHETCTLNGMRRWFGGELTCPPLVRVGRVPPLDDPIDAYHARWRGLCQTNAPPVFDKEMGMWKVKYVHTAYYEGDPSFPDYWLICDPPPDHEKKKVLGTGCHSAIQLSHDVYFDYTFGRELFWYHRQIYEGLKKKLQSFIVNQTTEEKGESK